MLLLSMRSGLGVDILTKTLKPDLKVFSCYLRTYHFAVIMHVCIKWISIQSEKHPAIGEKH